MSWLLAPSYAALVAAAGATVIGLVAGALGPFAVLRGRSLVGDALAHATLPGVVLAFLLVGAKTPTTLLLGAAAAAGLAALAVVALDRVGRTPGDAAIGVVLSGSFALGIVGLTAVSGRSGGDQAGLDAYLFGQAAGIVVADVLVAAAVGAVAVAAVIVGFRLLRTATFDPGFAAVAGVPARAVDVATTLLLVVAIVLAVRTVGAILTVALLTAPVVAARQVTRTLGRLVPVSALVGGLGGGLGTLLAAGGDLPPGPVVVLLVVAAAILAVLLAPSRGVLVRRLRPRAGARGERAAGPARAGRARGRGLDGEADRVLEGAR